MSEGWISIYRKLSETEIWLSEPFTRGQAWVDLILLANHKDGFIRVRGNRIEVKRGDVGYSILTLSKRWKWSRGKVNRFFEELKNDEKIVLKTDTETSNRITTVISIINYDLYQQNDNRTGNRRTTDGQQTDTNNNDNNDNNDNNKNKNRGLPLFSTPVKKTGLADMTDAMSATLDRIKNSKPARNVPEWMAHALEVSDKLKIDWNNHELVESKMKSRWFDLFKKTPWGKLQGAYSFCYDYPDKPDSAGIVKLFFWKVGGGTNG